jgi:FKBP-type peptidyl-prolyl cis-trans isomerase (trigger factor)
MKSEFKKLGGGEVSITGEIPTEQFANYRPQAVKNITEHIEIHGFRKGRVPENIIVQKLGEEKILYEMAELALNHSYPALLAEHNINPLGRPVISITKIAKGNPLGFSITVAVVPEVKLPDYKKIAASIATEKEGAIEVSEKEISEAIENIRKQTAKQIGGDGELPAFDDKFVKKLGNYTNVADFTVKLKDHLTREKTDLARSKKRMKIIDRILAGTEIAVPRIVVEEELNKMVVQFKGDIVHMGARFEDYLKHIGKTEEDMRKEFAPDAEKRSKIEFVLHKIASEEKIVPSAEEIEKETAHILEHHKDVDPVRARAYVTNIITNEKVLQFLENQGVAR